MGQRKRTTGGGSAFDQAHKIGTRAIINLEERDVTL